MKSDNVLNRNRGRERFPSLFWKWWLSRRQLPFNTLQNFSDVLCIVILTSLNRYVDLSLPESFIIRRSARNSTRWGKELISFVVSFFRSFYWSPYFVITELYRTCTIQISKRYCYCESIIEFVLNFGGYCCKEPPLRDSSSFIQLNILLVAIDIAQSHRIMHTFMHTYNRRFLKKRLVNFEKFRGPFLFMKLEKIGNQAVVKLDVNEGMSFENY